jgi:membrane-associated protease RseP (regulator of RpoE activity)
MTDQLTPFGKRQVEAPADQLPPPAFTRSDRMKSEIMAGGAVSEHGDDEVAGGWKGLLSMAAILALFVWLAFVNIWIFVFVVGVVISIFLHEMGHYLTAKWTGMKVTQFFLFFGPRLWSFRRGETEYGVRALPLGAFVRIIGMNRMDEVEAGDEARSYRQATFPRRLLVISAGSIMHILIAIVLLFGVYSTQGEITAQDEPRVIVGTAAQELPAWGAGIRDGDEIVTVDGIAVTSNVELGETIRTFEPGDVVDLVVIRDGETLTIPVGLGANTGVPEDDPRFGSALLGVSSGSPPVYQQHGIVGAAVNSVTDIFPVTWESTKGIVKVLNPVNLVNQVTDTENADPTARPTTIYGVANVSDEVGEAGGLAGVLYLLAILNIFVGVFNMAPLLPLDGGHAMIAVYERIQEKRKHTAGRYFADVERLMPFAMGVIVVLMMLMFTGLYLDITDPIG